MKTRKCLKVKPESRQIQEVSKINEIANPFVSTDFELSDYRW
jgi:hypothetical protein